jgi:hypothetical protein
MGLWSRSSGLNRARTDGKAPLSFLYPLSSILPLYPSSILYPLSSWSLYLSSSSPPATSTLCVAFLALCASWFRPAFASGSPPPFAPLSSSCCAQRRCFLCLMIMIQPLVMGPIVLMNLPPKTRCLARIRGCVLTFQHGFQLGLATRFPPALRRVKKRFLHAGLPGRALPRRLMGIKRPTCTRSTYQMN